MIRQESVCVLFGKELPSSPEQFALIIAPRTLEGELRSRDISFEALEDWVDPGNIKEATAFLGELARTTLPDGSRVVKSAVYKGYELWWIGYDDLYLRHCLPYTQYKRLLLRLTGFSSITLHMPPAPALFRHYLEAHGCSLVICGEPRTFPSLGIWLQVALSLVSIPVLLFTRPSVLFYTGDLFDPPRDHSFRMRNIYEAFRRRNVRFVEFIRSLESTRVMLSHAFIRRRPVIYSFAIKIVIAWASSLLPRKRFDIRGADPEKKFRLALVTMYISNREGTTWSIAVFSWIIRLIGVRSALVPAASSRTFHEIIACKLLGIPTVGVLHGSASRFYNVYDFMPEYDGDKRLGLDVYGMWSSWWRDYYLKYGKIYGPEELVVSGPIRPLQGKLPIRTEPSGPLKVLFIAEQLAVPEEVLPYLEQLMAAEGFDLYFKFRPYHDGFEEWLKKNRPDLLARMPVEKVMRGTMTEAIARTDVVVGSHSTAVLEAVLHDRPFVFFDTRKWGDYFDLASYNATYSVFARDPEEFIHFVRRSRQVPGAALAEMRGMFFGDPYQDGSAWAVEEVERRARIVLRGR